MVTDANMTEISDLVEALEALWLQYDGSEGWQEEFEIALTNLRLSVPWPENHWTRLPRVPDLESHGHGA